MDEVAGQDAPAGAGTSLPGEARAVDRRGARSALAEDIPALEQGDTRPSALTRQLLAAYTLLVVYASLHPFSGWRDPGVSPLAWISAALPRYITAFDVVANIVGYAPLGFLALLAQARLVDATPAWGGAATPASGGGATPASRLHKARAAVVAVLGPAVLSAAMESLQTYLPSRVASNVDLACNAAGALLGMLIGIALWRRLRPGEDLPALRQRLFRTGSAIDLGLVLLGLWLFSMLNPETLLYGNGDLRDLFQLADGHLHPAEVFIRFEAAEAAANALAVALLAATLARRGQPVRLIVLAVMLASLLARALAFALLFSSQDFLVWATPGAMFGAAAGTLVALIVVGLPRPLRLALCGLALMAGTAIVNIAPDNPYLSATLAAWPQGQFLHFNGMTHLVSVIWPFAALGYLMWLTGNADRRS